MKKMMTVLAAAVLMLTSTAFASEGMNVNEQVKAAFAKAFANATNVQWETNSGFYFVSFQVNNVRTDAAYNEEGKLVATSRNIGFDQLPLAVSVAISDNYAGYEHGATVTEISMDGETNYYINLGNDKQILTLKVAASGYITVDKKVKR